MFSAVCRRGGGLRFSGPRQSAYGERCRWPQEYAETPTLSAKGYERKPSWPLVLFLHGAGERGDNLDLIKKHGLPRLIAEGKKFPFIVVSPQCPATSGGNRPN